MSNADDESEYTKTNKLKIILNSINKGIDKRNGKKFELKNLLFELFFKFLKVL